MFDVIIIGAGPAGALAAAILGRRGHCVALVEQHRFPRDKVCGECLSSLGINVLRRAKLDCKLEALGPVSISRTIIHTRGGTSATLELPAPMWGLSRLAMDDALLNAAAESGATLMQPVRCEAITAAERPVARLRTLTDNSLAIIESRYILIADGKAALLPMKPRQTGDFGIKAHFQNINSPRDAVELFGVRGHYGGLAPIEEGRWNAAFSIPSARLAGARGRIDQLFAEVVAENRALGDRLRGAARCGPWLTTPLPRFAVARDWPQNVIPLGNAAAGLEPIGGEGMGLALRSAEIAAETIDRALCLKTTPDFHLMRKEFDQLWRARRTFYRGIALGISRPGIASIAVPLAACGLGAFALNAIQTARD